jgi:hypothetical protein
MHPYTADLEERKKVLRYLAVLAIALTIAFNYLVQSFKLPIPWFFDPPAVASFFGAVYWLFDKCLWSLKFGPFYLWQFKFGPFYPSKTPDLRGTWTGGILSSFKNSSGKETEVPVVVHIQQSWSEISIQLESSQSKSFTVMAAINLNDNSLRYVYRNEPKFYDFPPEHKGTCHLEISRDRKILKGKYYTSEGSNNTGTIILNFRTRDLIEFEEALKLAEL